MDIYLVVGGNGFLGRTLIDDLIERVTNEADKTATATTKRIFAIDIRKHHEFDEREIYGRYVKFYLGDICDTEFVTRVLLETRATVLFHTVSPPLTAPAHILHKVNIEGTRTLLDAARTSSSSCTRFILVSTASVIHSGGELQEADESYPYPSSGSSYTVYTETKIEQEKMVLEANEATSGSGSGSGFSTVAIRPSSLFGPRDPLFWPSVLASAKQGRLKMIVGSGKNLISFTYIRNVSHALLLAADKMRDEPDRSKIAGEAFFITNDEHSNMWQYMSDVVHHFGYPRPYIWIPETVYLMVCLVVSLLATVYGFFARRTIEVPVEYSFDKLAYLTKDRTFNIAKAKTVLGYKPRFTIQEGLEQTFPYFEAEWSVKNSNRDNRKKKD